MKEISLEYTRLSENLDYFIHTGLNLIVSVHFLKSMNLILISQLFSCQLTPWKKNKLYFQISRFLQIGAIYNNIYITTKRTCRNRKDYCHIQKYFFSKRFYFFSTNIILFAFESTAAYSGRKVFLKRYRRRSKRTTTMFSRRIGWQEKGGREWMMARNPGKQRTACAHTSWRATCGSFVQTPVLKPTYVPR